MDTVTEEIPRNMIDVVLDLEDDAKRLVYIVFGNMCAEVVKGGVRVWDKFFAETRWWRIALQPVRFEQLKPGDRFRYYGDWFVLLPESIVMAQVVLNLNAPYGIPDPLRIVLFDPAMVVGKVILVDCGRK